jgi:enoyl-CoA hydratase/carnithine racemase
MSADPLLWRQDGHVVTLTINRPEERNALSDEAMFAAFEQACARAQDDLSVRCVVLTGAGSVFSAGGNIKHMRDREGMFGGTPAEIQNKYATGIQRIPRALHALEVPVIAAVNGAAVGAGCDLACMCDIRIAAANASFAESFVRLGIIPGDGGAWFLPRTIGWARASEMAFTGDAIDAPTALQWGLVSRVVAADRLMEEAKALAARIAANPPQALRWTKRLMREAQHTGLSSALAQANAFQALAHHTKDHAEAVAAFFEKRPPRFTGG